MKILSLLAAFLPAALTAQQVALRPDSLVLRPGDTSRVIATVRGAPDSLLAFTGSNAAIFTAHRDGRITARGVGCAYARVSAGTWARAQIPVCVRAAVPTPVPVPPPTDAPTVLFASTWTTATGRTSAAFLDSQSRTPWGFACCDASTTSAIVTSASLGLTDWPAGNVYRVGIPDGSSGIPTHQLQADLGAPTAGSDRYFRYYLRVVYGDDHGSASEGMIEHGVETASSTFGGGRGMNFYRLPRNDGTWFPSYRDIASGWRYVASGLRLAKHRTYRMEWHLAYGATTYRVEVRVYDDHEALVATEADFFQFLPQRDPTQRLGTATFPYQAADHRYFRVGTNGPSSNFPMAAMRADALFDHGGVAVCATSWCGAWRP